MTGDVVQLLAALMTTAHPDAEVETDRIQPRALSVPKYIFIKEIGGTTPRPGRVDRPSVEVITYSQGGRSVGVEFARSVQMTIREAWYNQTVVPNQGHISHFETEVRPYPQAIEGLPAGTTRTSMILSIDIRPELTS